MQCHKCRHSAAVQAGQFKGVPFADTPCARCRLRHNSKHVMAFRPEVVAGEMGTAQKDEDKQFPAWVMTECVTGLLGLTPAMRDAVCWLGAGCTLAEIATRQGVSVALVDKRLRRAVEYWPAVGALFARRAVRSAQRQRRKQGETSAFGAETIRKVAVSDVFGKGAMGDAGDTNV